MEAGVESIIYILSISNDDVSLLLRSSETSNKKSILINPPRIYQD